MNNLFEPFTPDAFKLATGLNADDNEAIYLRWVNTKINYANFINMQEMAQSIKEIKEYLSSISFSEERY